MKYAFMLGAVLLVAVATQAAALPVEDKSYIVGDFKEALAEVTRRFRQKMAEIRAKINECLKELQSTTDTVREKAQEKLAELQQQLKDCANDFSQAIKDIFSRKDTTYGLAEIKEKIKELSGKIVKKSKELAACLAKIAVETAKPEIQKLLHLKEKITTEIRDLHAQIRQKIRDMFLEPDDTYNTQELDEFDDYSIASEVIGQLKLKIAEVMKKIKECTDELKTAADSKKAQLQVLLGQLNLELRGMFNDLNKAIREMLGRKTYSEDMPGDNFLVQKLKELREKINEKLEEIKMKLAIAKDLTGMAKDEAMNVVAALRSELKKMKADFAQTIREMFGRSYGAEML